MTKGHTKTSDNNSYNCVAHNALRYIYLLDAVNALLSHPLKCQDNAPVTNEYRTIGKDALALGDAVIKNPIPSAALALGLGVGAIYLWKPAITKPLKVQPAAGGTIAADADLDNGDTTPTSADTDYDTTDKTATHDVVGDILPAPDEVD